MKRTLWWPLILLVALAGCGADQVRLAKGDPAPDFALPALSGETVQLAELRGEVVAVHFWAEQCRFCEGEMRWLEEVHRRLEAEGFRLLGVNSGQDRKTVEGFVRRLEVITFPVLLDEASKVTRRYGVIGLPTTLLLDRQGIVRHKIIGESEPAMFEAMVRELLQTSGG
jgi:cytochrome c biogenesis protein CcmG/thiol:disulfide interchange protein DsbE